MCQIVFIVAVAKNGVIGSEGKIPWHCPEDMKRFKEVTMGYPIVMGRKTWDSLPIQPLPGRPNIVLSRNYNTQDDIPDAIVCKSLQEAMFITQSYEKIYVIGGAEIFKAYMEFADEVEISWLDIVVEGDVFWPGLSMTEWWMSKEIIGNGVKFQSYKRIQFPAGHYIKDDV